MINEFKGKYFYLSNFYKVPVTHNGITYRSNETTFQAQKTINKADRYVFAELNPSLSKKHSQMLIKKYTMAVGQLLCNSIKFILEKSLPRKKEMS